jgi:hypothetical protein
MRQRTPDPRIPALVAGMLLAFAGAAAADGYPRLGLYGGIGGLGEPFILGGNRYGPLDLAMCDSVARYDEVILDASPISEYRPDVAAALRARNPDIRLLAYVTAGLIWAAQEPDSTVHYPTRFHYMVRNLGGFLYNRAGSQYTGGNVNMAKRDGSGRYVVAEGLADLYYDAIVQSGVWDGIFLDCFCDRIAWTQTPAESIDFVRAGYPTLAAFDNAYEAGTNVLASRLRSLVGPSHVLAGNCAYGTKYTTLNGWMRENFPNQNGGNWYENMFRQPGGYFTDEANFLPPRHNYIFTAAEPPSAPYTPNNARKVRFGLGSASLADGYGAFGFSTRSVSEYNYLPWWYDEYAVDLANGRSSGQIAHTGWLGQPLGPASQMIWVGTAPDASTNPDFEINVTSGWTFVAGVPATLTQDVTTAAAGLASAKVHIPTAGDFDWRVNFSTTGTIPVSYGGTYSATFWAKASSPRQLPVILSVPGAGEVARRNVDLTTQWRRYQAVLVAAGNGNGKPVFYLSGTAGDVWLDDVHFQAGTSSFWRRDFQNGIVLVNPATGPLTAPLERTFRKLTGLVDPTINNGQSVTQVTVGGQDALFLLGTDAMAPSPVGDLHIVPR